jgi:excisionase family DNA binding protein
VITRNVIVMHDTALLSAEPDYYTARQAARRLRRPPRTVYDLISAGQLDAIQVRSRLRIRREVLDAYMAGLPKDEDLCEIGEAARLLQVHARTVAELIADGDLEAVKTPGRRGRRIRRTSLDQYLDRARA